MLSRGVCEVKYGGNGVLQVEWRIGGILGRNGALRKGKAWKNCTKDGKRGESGGMRRSCLKMSSEMKQDCNRGTMWSKAKNCGQFVVDGPRGTCGTIRKQSYQSIRWANNARELIHMNPISSIPIATPQSNLAITIITNHKLKEQSPALILLTSEKCPRTLPEIEWCMSKMKGCGEAFEEKCVGVSVSVVASNKCIVKNHWYIGLKWVWLSNLHHFFWLSRHRRTILRNQCVCQRWRGPWSLVG